MVNLFIKGQKIEVYNASELQEIILELVRNFENLNAVTIDYVTKDDVLISEAKQMSQPINDDDPNFVNLIKGVKM